MSSCYWHEWVALFGFIFHCLTHSCPLLCCASTLHSQSGKAVHAARVKIDGRSYGSVLAAKCVSLKALMVLLPWKQPAWLLLVFSLERPSSPPSDAPRALCSLAADTGAGHDRVQAEPASLPSRQASHQLHGCQTVSEAGRMTRRSPGVGGRRGWRARSTQPPLSPPSGRHSSD